MWLAHVVDATPRRGWGGWVGGMLTFHVACSRCWCYATQGLGWVGGGDANVPCDLLTLLMLRHAGVGVGGWGMLTFHVTCSRCWCYATQGLWWGGMLTFHVTCSRCWCYATQGLGWGGEVAFPVLREPWKLLKHLRSRSGCCTLLFYAGLQ